MKKIVFIVSTLLLLNACAGEKKALDSEAYTTLAAEDVVMYEVNPRVFAPTESFKAIEKRLDSIRKLGVNVVWFMPIYEIGKVKTVNSPYCIKDYKSVNPEFGTIDDFKHLVKCCHEKGMGVLLDWVANHTSWDNAWVEKHKDWYTQDSIGNIISPAGTGWNDVADLNFDNADMRLALIDAMKFWITESGVDGFRCDAADFVPFDFWKQAIDSIKAIPNRKLLMLAEGKRKDHFEAGFDMNYAWDYMEAIRDVFGKDSSAVRLLEINRAEYDTIPAGKVKLRFITNHDEASKMSPITELRGERAAMAAFAGTIFLHGGILLYSSQEIGYPSTINFFNYTSIDWSKGADVYNEYQRLITLYNEYSALRKGELTECSNSDVLIYQKSDQKDTFLICVNVRNKKVAVTLPDLWKGHEGIEVYKDTPIKLENELSLNPFEYKIIKRSKGKAI